MSREDDAENAEDLVDYIQLRMHCWERRALIAFGLCMALIAFMLVAYVLASIGLWL